MIPAHYGQAMKLGRSATKELRKIAENIGAPTLTEAQVKNVQELANMMQIPLCEIKPMTFELADSGAVNPNGNLDNCASAVAVFEARRRGLNIAVVPGTDEYKEIIDQIGDKFQSLWINPKTKEMPVPTIIKGTSIDDMVTKAEKQMKAPGRYLVGTNPTLGAGHMIVAERLPSGEIIYYCPQEDTGYKLQSFECVEYFEILKIDKLLFNSSLFRRIATKI